MSPADPNAATEKVGAMVAPGNFVGSSILAPRWLITLTGAVLTVFGAGFYVSRLVSGNEVTLVKLALADTRHSDSLHTVATRVDSVAAIVPVVRGLAAVLCQQSASLASPIFRGTIAQCDVPLVSPPGDWGRK